MKQKNIITDMQYPMLWLILLTLISQITLADEAIGHISFARGTNAAVQTGKTPRLLGSDSEIFQGDNIQTSERSFVIIAFNDGSKVTVRPNSSFSITEYNDSRDQQQAQLSLHKGGIRASSGDIARLDPDKYQITTPYAIVKAQQADYSVRLCQNDCAQEAEKLPPQADKKTQTVIARVVKIKGTVTAALQNPQAQAKEPPIQSQKRQLTNGAPLYTSDHLSSQKDSHALIAFRDGGRMTLQADSEFDISAYHYQQEGQKDQAFYNLVKGGLRALTGHIGKTERANYQINTPVATIGIRGTGFRLFCQGDCVDEKAKEKPQNKPTKKVIEGQAEGLYSSVWQGAISQTNTTGNYGLKAPNSNYIANKKVKPQKLKELPPKIRQDSSPRPDEIVVDETELFGSTNLQGVPSGVYVSVHNDGHVQLIKLTSTVTSADNTSTTLDLGKNEAGYISKDGKIVRLDQQQNFQAKDPYPLPLEFNKQQAETGIYSLLADNYSSQQGTPVYECVSN